MIERPASWAGELAGEPRLRNLPMNELILMAHVLFGVACILAAVCVFVDALHASPVNAGRIRAMSWSSAAFMWISFIIGGFWYVTRYHVDKAIILKGPWPFAHGFFMESKEHVAILLLLLATYLPIAARDNVAESRAARRVVLWTSALVVFVALSVEGAGAMIAMGVKVALLASRH
ncbi:MAG TPA: hypothetical protein VHH88_05735 [Verrucomicrobiae bacterium]|nr:hypothetical protein [Verrucomicrobiae bacterium]